MKLLLSILFFLLANPLLAANPHSQTKLDHNYIGIHGMALLIGPNRELIANHMPLYSRPHDYQILYRLASKDKRIEALRSKNLVSLLPEKFDLSKLIDGKRIRLEVDVYGGHFERSGIFLFKTLLTFEEPLFIRGIENKPDQNNGIFKTIVVNKNVGLHIHLIAKPPSFDAIAWSPIEEGGKDHHDIRCKNRQFNSRKQVSTNIESCLKQDLAYIEVLDFSL